MCRVFVIVTLQLVTDVGKRVKRKNAEPDSKLAGRYILAREQNAGWNSQLSDAVTHIRPDINFFSLLLVRRRLNCLQLRIAVVITLFDIVAR